MEQARALWKRLAAEAGLNLVDGSFEEGAEITSSSDVVWWQAGSAIYGWHLNEAKTVPAGSTPATAGGIGAGAWSDKTDLMVRSDLNKKTAYASLQNSIPNGALTLQSFLNSDSDRFVIDVPITVTKAELEALPLYGLQVPAGKTVIWKTGAFTTLEPGVEVRHIFTGQGASNSHVKYINPQIDGNDSACNGIGGNNGTDSRLEDVWVFGGNIKNIRRAKYRGSFEGGAGVTFQFGAKNCGAVGVNCYKVFQPCNAAGKETTTSYGDQSSYNIIFDSFHCENCETLGASINLLTN